LTSQKFDRSLNFFFGIPHRYFNP